MPSPSFVTRDRTFRFALAAVIAFCGLQIALYHHGRDQGIYALVARTLLEGGMPYRDAFDFKPPGIFVIYALGRLLSGSGEWGIRLIEVAGLFAMVAAMVAMAGRWWGDRTIGWLAGALTALVHAQLEFWHTAQPETFGGMLSIFGVWCVCTPNGRTEREEPLPAWRYLVAGVAFGMTGLLKPPLAGGGAVLGLWAAFEAKRGGRPWRAVLRPVAIVFIGGVLPVALCLGWFWAQGALAALHETLFVFTPHYTELSWRDRTLRGMLYQSLTEWFVNYASILTIGLALGLATWQTAWKRTGVTLVIGIIAVQLVGVALQAKFFPYHYGATWPFTALLAALGWHSLWGWANGRGAVLGSASRISVAARSWLFIGALVIAAQLRTATKDLAGSFWERAGYRLSLVAGGWKDDVKIDGLATVADVNANGNRQVAELLRKHVPANGSAFVWGFEPVIYDLANVRAASRFIYNVPQRVAWAQQASRSELMCELLTNRPQAIVVASGDVFPVVTDNIFGSDYVLNHDFPELRNLLDSTYRKHSRVDDFDVYLRADAGAPSLEGPR